MAELVLTPLTVPRIPGFDLVARIGKGGMGEVWEAVRVGPAGFRKSVAIKQLPRESAIDSISVHRFLQEARISAQLDHPNIVRVHDLLVLDGHYIVMELLRGRNASDALKYLAPQGPAAWPLLVEIAEQTLAGLEYAHLLKDEAGHSLGLVHRDLTPRNLFLTESGTVKILDFGIAKLRNALTPGLTRQGAFIGTLGFLPPEQARAEEVDARSDIFQVGAVLYWGLSGKPPNGAGTAGEILARAVAAQIQPIKELRPDLPQGLIALIDRALSGKPGDRPQTAAEMRKALKEVAREAPETGPSVIAEVIGKLPPSPKEIPALSRNNLGPDVSTAGVGDTWIKNPAEEQQPAPPAPVEAPKPAKRSLLPLVLLSIVAAIFAFFVGRATLPRQIPAQPTTLVEPAKIPNFHRLTYRRGTINGARFLPGGDAFVFGAAWGGEPPNVFLGRFGHPEVRSLNFPGARLLGVSASGELALMRNTQIRYAVVPVGTLAVGALAGGEPKDLLENVGWADWTPQGELALVRWFGDRTTLELPKGNVLHSTDAGYYGSPKISPDGSKIAFFFFTRRYDVTGYLAVIDRAGKMEKLSESWATANGISWIGDQIYFTASSSLSMELHAASSQQPARLVFRAPANIIIDDAAPDGRMLLRSEITDLRVSAGRDGKEHDLSWFDSTIAMDVTSDARWVLTGDNGDAVGAEYSMYMRPFDGGAAVRLSPGLPGGLSPDARWAAAIAPDLRSIAIVPVGAGETRHVPLDVSNAQIETASWFADGKRLLVGATTETKGLELWVLSLESDHWTPVPREGLDLVRGGNPIAPNGEEVAARDAESGLIQRINLANGGVTAVPGAIPGEAVVRWSSDGRALYVARFGAVPLEVFRLELSTGKRQRIYELAPADRAGVLSVIRTVTTPDAKAYAYTYLRLLSTLYLAQGLAR